MAQCPLVLKFNNLRAKGHCAKVYIGAEVLKGGNMKNMKDVKNLTVQEAIFLETVRGNKDAAFELIAAYMCGNPYMEQALKSAISDGDTTFVSGVLFCEPPTSYCYMSFFEAEQRENFYGTSPHRGFGGNTKMFTLSLNRWVCLNTPSGFSAGMSVGKLKMAVVWP